jgi:sulfite reductase alpha subunit-like flavoprotein
MFYVAGNSKLPEEIRITLAEMLADSDSSGEGTGDGDRAVADLEASNRIQYDCW